MRPPEVRLKPRVSAFTSARLDKIVALQPDLVLAFSDLQADIAAELIRRNVAVHAFNQRDVAGILAMVRTLGALVGASSKAEASTTIIGDHVQRGLPELVTPRGSFRDGAPGARAIHRASAARRLGEFH